MAERELHAVTGAFTFSGRYIARRLFDAGRQVVTLTNSRNRPDPFNGRVGVYPLRFEKGELISSLQGVSVLYSTYYVRFNYKGRVSFSYSEAVNDSSMLFAAAREAGVRRIVHISITNPSENSRFEYFRDKARIERAIRESGLSHSVLRPAVLFGDEGILINNIAWLLRRFPLFAVFGDESYRLQPI